jgi:hypothetical protein
MLLPFQDAAALLCQLPSLTECMWETRFNYEALAVMS